MPLPPPPAGQLSLAIEAAAWAGEGSLIVQVRVGNGAGAQPAALAPSSFALGLSGGAELTASAFPSALLGNPCRPELAVAAGGSVACQLSFDSVLGTPQQVHLRLADRMASAALAVCAPASPTGLCSAGLVCQSGSCVTPCGPSEPTGVCASPSELCVGGDCLPRCSPSVPTGACEVGICQAGSCNTSCRSIDTGAPGCFDCILPFIDGKGPCPLASSECLDCAQCPISGSTDCECLTASECQGCQSEAPPIWSCVASLCPVCFATPP